MTDALEELEGLEPRNAGAKLSQAFEFFKKQGVEMTELDDEVQFAARKIGLEWADKTASEGKNKYFTEVHKSQMAFDEAWRHADSWRKVKVKPA